MYTREEFENLINNSPLFDIDKDSSPMLYKTEKYNLLTLITDYYRFYEYRNKELDSYSMTLMEAAAECIKYYDRQRQFLPLFKTVMKRKLHIDKAKELAEEYRQGIKLSDYDSRLISKITAYAKSKGLDFNDTSMQHKVAEVLAIDLEEVKRLIRVNEDAVTVHSTVKNDDGDEIELYDYQSDSELFEEQLVEEEAIDELVGKIDGVFSSIQNRQKKMISMLLTAKIIKALDYDIEKAKRVLRKRQLLDIETFEYFLQNNELPTAKQVGLICNVSEQSLSRAYKNFKEKLKSVKSIKNQFYIVLEAKV